MRLYKKGCKGFTLIEILVVIAIVGLLASVAIPAYLNYVKKARSTQCHVDRGAVQNVIVQYYHDNPDTELKSLKQLVTEGYLKKEPNCPLDGEYVLIPAEIVGSYCPVVACSMHYLPTTLPPAPKPPKPLTSLGSNFEEISSGMISLIEEFYKKHGRYPRSWGDYKFTDIGLDPAEWSNSYNGIIYKPAGNSTRIRPAKGSTFYVTSLKGKKRKLSWKYKWDLVYSVEKKQWYYHSIKKGNEIDISTLQVI